MQIGRVIEQIESQRLISAIASFGQQFFRFFITFFLRPLEPFRLNQLHAIGVRRRIAVGWQVALILHLIDNNVAIQRHLQRSTHANVGKRRFLVIDFVIISAQIRIDVNFFRDLFFQFLEQFDRHVVIGHIDFAAAVAVDVGDFRRNRQEGDLINHGFGVIPVVGITLQNNAFVNNPIF